jgi:yeast amino acid transporter
VNIGVWIAVFYVVLAAIQVFGVRGYAEGKYRACIDKTPSKTLLIPFSVEFVLALIKICAIVGFIILGIVIDCGGVPSQHTGYIGAKYWHDPGAFRNGFKGFCSVFVAAAFSFAGTELVGLAAAECKDPARAIPKACKQVFWRIVVIYLVSLFILGLIVPSNSPYLLGAHGSATKYSPFVGAIKSAGIRALPSIFNAVITISVLSVANSVTYGSSRLLHALSKQGMAPGFLNRVDSRGRPM